MNCAPRASGGTVASKRHWEVHATQPALARSTEGSVALNEIKQQKTKMVWPDTLPDTAAEELLTHLRNKRDGKPGADSAKLKYPTTETHPAGVIEVSKYSLAPQKRFTPLGYFHDKSRLPLCNFGERGVKMAIDYAVDDIATELVLEGHVATLTSIQFRAKVLGHIRRTLHVDAQELTKTDFGFDLSLAIHRKIMEEVQLRRPTQSKFKKSNWISLASRIYKR